MFTGVRQQKRPGIMPVVKIRSRTSCYKVQQAPVAAATCSILYTTSTDELTF